MSFDLDLFSEHGRSLLLISFVVTATSFPFLQRAYFVDDFYHVTMAKGILEHPTRPYDFRADDAGHDNIAWERGQAPRMVNPPLFHYYLAGAMKFVGQDTRLLRTSVLVFPLVAAWCLYFLGLRFVDRPLLATLLASVTPAFWLTSYSLLIDSAMLAWLLAAILSFIKAGEEKSIPWSLLSGLFMSLAFLTKYVAILVLPLALLWQLQDEEYRRWRLGYIAYAVLLAMTVAWGVWGIQTYGQMHLLATFHRGFHSSTLAGLILLALLFAGLLFQKSEWKGVRANFLFWALALGMLIAGRLLISDTSAWLQQYYLDKLIVVGTFIAGGFIFVLAVPLLAWDERPLLLYTAVGTGCLLTWLFLHFGDFTFVQAILLGGLIAGTGSFLVMAGKMLSPLEDPTDRFLLFWLLGGVAEMIVVMPWTAGRYFLLVLPAAVWVFGRILARTRSRGMWTTVMAITALSGGILAFVDFIQADAIVRLADTLETRRTQLETLAPPAKNRWYYLGDTFSGSEPYLGPLGWRNVFPNDELKSGDLLLMPRYRLSSWWKVPHPERFRPVFVVEMKSKLPVRVMDIPAGAGFYGSCWGPLPFVVTGHPVERFELFQVK